MTFIITQGFNFKTIAFNKHCSSLYLVCNKKKYNLSLSTVTTKELNVEN